MNKSMGMASKATSAALGGSPAVVQIHIHLGGSLGESSQPPFANESEDSHDSEDGDADDQLAALSKIVFDAKSSTGDLKATYEDLKKQKWSEELQSDVDALIKFLREKLDYHL